MGLHQLFFISGDFLEKFGAILLIIFAILKHCAELNEHAGVRCKCKSGYELIGEECVRLNFPELVTPTPPFVVQEVETSLGKLRLVSGEGECQDDMSGRIEIFFNDVTAPSVTHSAWVADRFVELRSTEWLTLDNWGFSMIQSRSICRTLYGKGAATKKRYSNSDCGTSESRYARIVCNDETNDFPKGCNMYGPYRGCTAEGCELEYPDGATRPFPTNDIDTLKHSAVSCECRKGFEFASDGDLRDGSQISLRDIPSRKSPPPL